MRGVILAGGEGTRLRPATGLYNKHIALVYDRPMISYPLETLRQLGCDAATIVSNRTGVGQIAEYVQDGEAFGLDVEYKVTTQNTIPATLAKVSIKGAFPMILGDCYYSVPPRPAQPDQATLFWHDFPTGDQHSVWIPEANAIVEKPRFMDVGKRAIVGYVYDERVFDFIDNENPTEIVDLHNFYRESGADMVEYQGFFGDMGTPDGLLRVATYVKEQNGH